MTSQIEDAGTITFGQELLAFFASTVLTSLFLFRTEFGFPLALHSTIVLLSYIALRVLFSGIWSAPKLKFLALNFFFGNSVQLALVGYHQIYALPILMHSMIFGIYFAVGAVLGRASISVIKQLKRYEKTTR